MRPKFPQPIDAGIRRVARDDGGIDRSDRYAGDPVGMDIGFRKRLVDTSLICAERTAALQQQGNALKRQPPFRGREMWSMLEIHCLLSVWSVRTISRVRLAVLLGVRKRIFFPG